ncbi:hypothetical protein ASC80_03255 [Afipia sp. Root123D2]|uniref:hypothetical protein n=1 Tax=Afipia sp. Root123D2 TaxID=1736436 RepID=UPI0006FAB49D|nr:hypothetical protein [Afipia sp. Root123D2]KQW22420.1 hypothetical protein ASC80_03255 [Afipia sp. Root123D2]
MTGLARRAVAARYLTQCAIVWTALALSGPATASSAADAAQQWGLLGIWAIDCNVPPDRNRGARLTYRVAEDGRLVHDRDFGDITDSHDVRDATIGTDGSLVLTVDFPELKQTREYSLGKEPDGSIRALSNRSSNGRFTIRNGRFTDNGKVTPKQVRCD